MGDTLQLKAKYNDNSNGLYYLTICLSLTDVEAENCIKSLRREGNAGIQILQQLTSKLKVETRNQMKVETRANEIKQTKNNNENIPSFCFQAIPCRKKFLPTFINQSFH